MSVYLSTILTGILLATATVSPADTTLTVAAAADLSALEPELSTAFCKNEANVRVRFVTESSGVLSQQIENGAPYDVFMSANAAFVDGLASFRKLLPDSVLTYAQGHLGVLWRDGKTHPFKDLTADWVRFVALPNPKLAPYGVAAQEALEHLGIWAQVQPKVVYGENVRQTLQLFDSGNADAVLTAGSLLKGRSAEFVPQNWHQPRSSEGGSCLGQRQSRARPPLHCKFLTSPAGQAVFAKYGFGSLRP